MPRSSAVRPETRADSTEAAASILAVTLLSYPDRYGIVFIVPSAFWARGMEMPEVTLNVDAGVCQFKTVIIATMDDEMNIVYKIKSACPAVREMAKDVGPIPLFEAIAMPFTENTIYKKCNALQHVACPVPCGMVKAAEAAGEMALKKPVSFQWE